MKTTFDPTPDSGQSGAGLPAALSRWYNAHPAVRRLRAIEDSTTVRILVTLEPTLDGHDTLPVWLAYSRHWTRDLQQLANRDVELRLVDIDEVAHSYEAADTTLLAELHWRDPLDDTLT